MDDRLVTQDVELSSPAVFVSYAREDVAFVDRLVQDLRSSGIDVWKDTDEIYVGEYLLPKVVDAIRSCKLFLAVISTYYGQSKWCRHEVTLKLTEEVSQGRVLVLPLRLDETDPEALVPAKGWADFRERDAYQEALANLLMSISYHLDTTVERLKQQKLEDILKQQYVGACYGTVSKADVLRRFHVAATMNPQSVFLWRALGYIYHYHLADFARAEHYYLRALEIEPDNAVLTRALGTLYFHRGDHMRAERYLLRARDLGYSSSSEWQDYANADVSYEHGQHGGGGIPNLFGSNQRDIEQFIEKRIAARMDAPDAAG